MWILELYKKHKLEDLLASDNFEELQNFIKNCLKKEKNIEVSFSWNVDNRGNSYFIVQKMFEDSEVEYIGDITEKDLSSWKGIFEFLEKYTPDIPNISVKDFNNSTKITFSRQKNIDFSEEKIKKLSDIINIKCGD